MGRTTESRDVMKGVALVFVFLVCLPEDVRGLNITAVPEMVKKMSGHLNQWWDTHSETELLITYCLEHRETCDLKPLLMKSIGQCASDLVSTISSSPHSGGTRPVPDSVDQLLDKGDHVFTSYRFAKNRTVYSLYLWVALFSALTLFDGDTPIVDVITRLVEKQMSKRIVVLGEPLSAKVTRWSAIHAAYPDFKSWYSTFSNRDAGIDRWGGTSRLCIDWLPFMFKDYMDDTAVDEFFDGNAWLDREGIFEPNENSARVNVLKFVSKEMDRYKQSLLAKNQRIRQSFFSTPEVAHAARVRLRRAFDMMDGRSGEPDAHAPEYQLLESDLKNCWDIMETALETKPVNSKTKSAAELVMTMIKFAHNITVLVLGILMIQQYAERSVLPVVAGCPALSAAESAGGKGLTDDQYICSDQSNVGSICWMICDGLTESMNPVDIDGRPAVSFVVCEGTGIWTGGEMKCINTADSWRQPFL